MFVGGKKSQGNVINNTSMKMAKKKRKHININIQTNNPYRQDIKNKQRAIFVQQLLYI